MKPGTNWLGFDWITEFTEFTEFKLNSLGDWVLLGMLSFIWFAETNGFYLNYWVDYLSFSWIAELAEFIWFAEL